MTSLAWMLVLWVLSKRSTSCATPGVVIQPAEGGNAPPAPPPASPWPAAVPASLPPLGQGWVPDDPVPPEVQARAAQLLAQLWQQGAGTIVQEMTGGRWITYRAEPMPDGSRGVVAYRQAGDTPGAPPQPAPGTPQGDVFVGPPQVITPPNLPPGPQVLAQFPFALQPAGTRAPTADVQRFLNDMGYGPLDVDNVLGPQTTAALQAYQTDRGLSADGVPGPQFIRQSWADLAYLGTQGITFPDLAPKA